MASLSPQAPSTNVSGLGKNDPIFGPKGAQAFKRDVPDAEIHLLDTGHFALEEYVNAVKGFLLDFMEKTAHETR